MYNVVIYPYDNTNKQIILQMNKDLYKVTGIVSPKGWGYCGERIFSNGIDCDVKESITEIEEDFDCVCIIESRFSLDIVPSFEKILNTCKERNLEVIWCRKSTFEELKKVEKYVSKEKLHIIENTFNDSENQKIYDINVPVVFVIDMFSEMNSSDTELKLLSEIERRGFQTKLVTKNKSMKLIKNVELIPDSFFDEYISSRNKIIIFNQYIKSIEKGMDLILIDIPGNAVEVSKDILGDFGQSLFMISRTLLADYVICNMPYVDMMEEKSTLLEMFIESRVETNVDAFSIIPEYFDLVNSESLREMDYTTLSKEFVDRKRADSKKIFYLQNKDEVIRLIDNIIAKFDSYSEINII